MGESLRRGLRGKVKEKGGKAKEVRRKKVKEKQQFAKSPCVMYTGNNENNVILCLVIQQQFLVDKGMITKVLNNSAKKIQLSSL